jgi:hypothetical protein
MMKIRMPVKTRSAITGALLLVLTLCSVATAQQGSGDKPEEHPNFSGRWRMVKDLSQFDKFKVPDIITRIVDQHGTTMNVHTVQTTGKDTTTSDVSYFTDGTESQNMMSGRSATSKAFWDGSALMIRTITRDSKNEDIEIVDRWELSSDGKQLVNTSDIGTPSGGAHLKLVCDKQ